MHTDNSDSARRRPVMLSMREVTVLTTYSRPSIYRLIATRGFPRPIKMGDVKIAFLAHG
jgi:predicted DNA-binding transcriptional regulator AlpA